MASEQERWIGRRVGAYEIVALIGSGGMGEVYRARRIDAQYDKEVAIKLVPSGLPASFVLRRLRAERQILARLDHPHIAQLIDGGATEDGLPYLVMDLVEGIPLDRYCEERDLPIRRRLQLFRDVCSAVSHAHQNLIVHRDLKPANILVTADGTVKLLDFGIAKLLQPDFPTNVPAQTVTSVNTLTLEFSSPEQVLGRTITTASDVYSLGVILYVLLTRRLPYLMNVVPLHEAIREICEIEPARPSVARSRGPRRPGEKLDADLDAITLRALRKEPEKRYRSVDELSEDARLYLDGLPVVARGGQLTYRAGKFVRRHKLWLVAAGVFAMMLTGGIVTSLQQARIAEEQRARAERHVDTLQEILRQMDTVQVRYLLAASEQGIAAVHVDRAARARQGSAAQLRSLRDAKEWYAKAVPRFESVTSRITLEYPDRQPMDDAIAGLEKITAMLARLENTPGR